VSPSGLDQNNITTDYISNTSRRFNVGDGRSVTDFGPMTNIGCGGFIACVRTRYQNNPTCSNCRHQYLEADLRFSSENVYFWTYTSGPPGNYYDLWSVAAHEAGHRIGLDHAAGTDLTMYYQTTAGDTKQRTLGRGDILGMCQLYPATLPKSGDGDVVNAPQGIEGSDSTDVP